MLADNNSRGDCTNKMKIYQEIRGQLSFNYRRLEIDRIIHEWFQHISTT